MRLLRFDENILKPAQPIQLAKTCRHSRRIELFAGLKRQSRPCRVRSNSMQSYKPDFVDVCMRRQAIGRVSRGRVAGIACLRTRKGRCDREQPEKAYGNGRTSAHLFVHQEMTELRDETVRLKVVRPVSVGRAALARAPRNFRLIDLRTAARVRSAARANRWAPDQLDLWDPSSPAKPPQDLRDFKVQEMRT